MIRHHSAAAALVPLITLITTLVVFVRNDFQLVSSVYAQLDDTPTERVENAAADFSMSSSPSSRTILQGDSASYTVTLDAVGGFADPVALSVIGLPPRATASLDPNGLIGGGSSTLTVTTGSKTPAGISILTIVATSGVLTRTTSVTLIVTSSPNFAIAVVPGSRTVVPGGSANYTVTIDALYGFSGDVDLGAAGLPSGASASFVPDSIAGAGSATLTLTTTPGVSLGTSLITITGSSGPLQHSTTTLLVVAPTGAEQVIGIDFVGAGTPMELWETAGVVARPNWNRAAGALRATPLALVDETGTASGATVTWTATDTGRVPIKATPGNRRMMRGYLDTTTGNVSTVDVAGLPVAAYDVYVYVDGDNANIAKSAAYTLSGAGITTTTIELIDAANTNFSSGFTPAVNSTGNYLKFSIVATAFTLTATPGALDNDRAPINGVQIRRTAAAPAIYSISGGITPASDGAGASVTLGGTAAAITTADAAGSYIFTNLTRGSYLVTAAKSGFMFSPPNRNVSVIRDSVAAVDFTASQTSNVLSMSSPGNGATVQNEFSMSASASASIVAVQFQVDGVNAGPEDTTAPFSVSVTASNGSHLLRAVGRDAGGNTIVSTPITVNVSGGPTMTLTVNGEHAFQTIDGFGVNINSLSWKNGELAPALDRLIGELGSATWRVVFDMTDWEDPNDNADPSVPDWTYYNALYSNAKFQNLWGTLRYLNQKGVTSRIILCFMGRVPPWMGGATITDTPQMEDEFVETIATLVYYARNTENVQFDLLDPLNEPDWDGIEGPQIEASRYPGLLQKLSARLDAMGLGSVRFVGPNTAQIKTGVEQYLPELFDNSVVMSKLDHFGLHNYNGEAGNADATINASPYPQKNFWMTELSIPEQIFALIGQGAAGAQIWDAYDSVYNHAILAGRGTTPPNDAGNLAALMSYSTSTGLYTARPQFYQMQTFKYITPGSIRVATFESTPNPDLTIYAFRHATTGRVTLVGRNTGGSITINASLSGVGVVNVLEFYRTTASNNFSTFTRGPDALITNGAFVFAVPADSFFTLTGLGQ